MIAHAVSTLIPGDNVMDSAELINNEPKYLNRSLKSNKISIDAYKTNCSHIIKMKNVRLSGYMGTTKKNYETSFTMFLGIHLDKKINFVNNLTEM